MIEQQEAYNPTALYKPVEEMSREELIEAVAFLRQALEQERLSGSVMYRAAETPHPINWRGIPVKP